MVGIEKQRSASAVGPMLVGAALCGIGSHESSWPPGRPESSFRRSRAWSSPSWWRRVDTSGVGAWMLQADPSALPDEVRCCLLSSADRAVDPATAELACGVFQQGAGLVDAYGAVHETAAGVYSWVDQE